MFWSNLNRPRRRGAVLVLASLALVGCGGPAVTVTGRVTCEDKPVVGLILFSPKGENAQNPGHSVSAPLGDDGRFQIRLTTVGKHTIVITPITPRDVTLRPKPSAFDYPCDRSPLERDLQPGENDLTIELTKRNP
jgi:hypothetical protein